MANVKMSDVCDAVSGASDAIGKMIQEPGMTVDKVKEYSGRLQSWIDVLEDVLRRVDANLEIQITDQEVQKLSHCPAVVIAIGSDCLEG